MCSLLTMLSDNTFKIPLITVSQKKNSFVKYQQKKYLCEKWLNRTKTYRDNCIKEVSKKDIIFINRRVRY